MAITSASLPAKKRILTVCVKLFLEKGYRKTTLAKSSTKPRFHTARFRTFSVPRTAC